MTRQLSESTRPRRGIEQRTLPTYAAGAFTPSEPVSTFEEVVRRDTEWGPHSHPTHELLWNERGVSTVGVGTRVWTITPTLGVWMPAGIVHAATAVAGTWYRTAHFDTTRVAPLAEGVAVVEITPLLRLLLARLSDSTLTPPSRRVTEEMVLDVLEPAAREITVSVPASELLAPIVRAFQEDPADDRSLEQWSEELGVSGKTLTRAFRSETGLTFSKWSTAVRVQHAIYLLGGGTATDEVAEVVGYSTVSAFGAAFKRVTGTTPSAFKDVHLAI